MNKWEIGLEAWVIQDGNYPEFRVGQTAEFALSFYETAPVNKVNVINKEICHVKDNMYNVIGKIVFVKDRAWVVDFGPILAYQNVGLPSNCKIGDYILGTIVLFVDEFIYFERLCHFEGVPPMVYSWNIKQILRKPTNEAMLKSHRCEETDGRNEGYDFYLLTCDKLNLDAKFESVTAIYP